MRTSIAKAPKVLLSAMLSFTFFTMAAHTVTAETVQSQAGINAVGTAGTGADGGNMAVAYQNATTSATGGDSFEGSGSASVSSPPGQGASMTTQSPGGALSASVVAGDQSGSSLDASVSASGGDGMGDGTGEDEGLFASSYAFASATPPDELPAGLSLIAGQDPDAFTIFDRNSGSFVTFGSLTAADEGEAGATIETSANLSGLYGFATSPGAGALFNNAQASSSIDNLDGIYQRASSASVDFAQTTGSGSIGDFIAYQGTDGSLNPTGAWFLGLFPDGTTVFDHLSIGSGTLGSQ